MVIQGSLTVRFFLHLINFEYTTLQVGVFRSLQAFLSESSLEANGSKAREGEPSYSRWISLHFQYFWSLFSHGIFNLAQKLWVSWKPSPKRILGVCDISSGIILGLFFPSSFFPWLWLCQTNFIFFLCRCWEYHGYVAYIIILLRTKVLSTVIFFSKLINFLNIQHFVFFMLSRSLS